MTAPDFVEQRTLWTLRQGLRLAEVRLCVTDGEARVLTYIGGALHGILRVEPTETALLHAHAVKLRDDLVNSGWQQFASDSTGA